jgi:formate hydrogenlyase transcriptional activator
MLLTDGSVLKEMHIPNSYKDREEEKRQEFLIKTIHENERDYITYILEKCKGKVSGVGGAAEILNIPPSTLNSKIKKLGIVNSH